MPRVDPAAVDEATAPQNPKHRRTLPGVVAIAVLLVLATLLAARMVPHPVGPARTFGKYNGKATSTADAAVSDVRTVALVARARRDHDAFGPYTSVVISDAEESVSGAQGTFDSIQPPDARADQLQKELDDLLSSALKQVQAARVAARRSDSRALAALVAPLDKAAADLEAFTDEHS
jgi:hypothetical protein